MNNTARGIVVAIAMIALLACSCSDARSQNTFAFTRVNVVPMDREIVLKDHTVIVENGRIVEVGPSSSATIPRGAMEIDVKGKFMIPALSDMHVHLEGDAWNIMYAPESRFTREEIDFDDILFMYIANGITTIDVLFAFPEHIPLRERIKKNEMLGPRLILSRMIDGAGKGWPPPLGIWINNADEARKAIIEIQKQGYDRIKVYSFLDRESYDAIITTAKDLGMPVDGHVPFATSVEHVLSSNQHMIAHIEEIMKFARGYNAGQVGYYADLIAGSNTWVTSSLILNHNLNALLEDSAGQFSKSGTEYLHPMGLGIWRYVYSNLYKPIPEKARRKMIDGYNLFQKPFAYEFYKRGGNLLAGTDALVPSTLPGVSLHEELEELVGAGLSPFEALRISTTNTYAFLGELDGAGTIEPGKAANLVMLDDNPLENISHTRNIVGVMTQNRWISKSDIDRRLKEIAYAYSELRKRKAQ
jgi:imidazolonepropionase-like amidohydrolase